MGGMKNIDRRESIQRWLAERRERGLTFKQLSECSGIPVPTLTGWAWRLRKEEASLDGSLGVAPFVEIGVRRASVPSSPFSQMQIEFSGCVIHLGQDFDEALFVRVLRAVKSFSAC